MINANVGRLVIVNVLNSEWAIYNGHQLRVILVRKPNLKPGSRRLRLQYSIINDEYYLTDRG